MAVDRGPTLHVLSWINKVVLFALASHSACLTKKNVHTPSKANPRFSQRRTVLEHGEATTASTHKDVAEAKLRN